ncbi:MAG: STAS domain-containing protein [Pseudonocardiales bacterium]|nr:STAS domain-containing protein [Pseudonocardiales bacterium]
MSSQDSKHDAADHAGDIDADDALTARRFGGDRFTVTMEQSAGSRAAPVVLSVTGELDFATIGQFHDVHAKALAVLADAPQRGLVVDLSRVDFLGSTALAALIAIHRELTLRGGWLRIVTGGGRRVRHPFEATRLDAVLPLYNTMSDALANEG